MKRTFRALAITVVASLMASGVSFAGTIREASGFPRGTSDRSKSPDSFINSMKLANATRFLATYRIDDYLFFQGGTITIAQIPSPPGTKATTNVDGYSATGRRAYLFHGPRGRIAQWIKIGTNVSACERPAGGGTLGRLECSRPSPFIPSNGFAMEDAGFVLTYVLQTMTETLGVRSLKNSTLKAKKSSKYGTLQCLTEISGPTTSTTCIDRAGYLVSWLLQNGSATASSATLVKLGHNPTANDFKTLVAPTKSLILPAV